MKVLIISSSDLDGGAARAAYRLHQALLAVGVNSHMLVQRKKSDDYRVVGPRSKVGIAFGYLFATFDQFLTKFFRDKSKTLFSPQLVNSCNLAKYVDDINPDIINLHWINNGFVSLSSLTKLNRPLVWSLHDMWPFTGGCHYDEECQGYLDACKVCPVLGSSSSLALSRYQFRKKYRVYKELDITVVGLSQWITQSARQSVLLRDKNIVNLPNPINVDVYKAIDRGTSRSIWNLSTNKKYVLFGAMSATTDPRKGFEYLVKALSAITGDNVELIIFGSSTPEHPVDFGFPVRYLGSLSDDQSLASLYSAVDVMVVPSIQENLSNAIVESLSCGTPVVAFNIGGNSDLICHKVSGYLATPKDIDDLATGIQFVLDSCVDLDVNAAWTSEFRHNFSYEHVGNKYKELFKGILRR